MLPPYGYWYTTTATSNTNKWNFYAVQVNVPSSSGTITGNMYVNGNSEPVNVAMVKNTTDVNPTNINIGRFRNGSWGTTYFNGSIDDVRLYNRPLSASEIKQLYNMGR